MSDQNSLYQIVAARRAQWDMLLWQVPVLSFTAQAFLFQISLGSSTSRTARIIAALLSALMAYLSITLMARHRQAEITDAQWLALHEGASFGVGQAPHGDEWRARRDVVGRNHLVRIDDRSITAAVARRAPLVPGYKTWIFGLALFLLASAALLVISLVDVSLLEAASR